MNAAAYNVVRMDDHQTTPRSDVYKSYPERIADIVAKAGIAPPKLERKPQPAMTPLSRETVRAVIVAHLENTTPLI